MVYSNIRAQARENLRDNWGQSIGAALVAALLGGSVTAVSSGFNINLDAQTLQAMPDSVAAIFTVLLSAAGIWGLVQFIIGGTIQLGYTVYLMKQYHRQETRLNDLFSQFFRFGQGFAQKFLCGLYTFLWALLFIIPGIIKSYSYAMTPFILADHPELTANEAITRSRVLMDGHKFELFVLELSFIGWELLSILTLGIGLLWLIPYMSAARAAFYREIAGYPRITVE